MAAIILDQRLPGCKSGETTQKGPTLQIEGPGRGAASLEALPHQGITEHVGDLHQFSDHHPRRHLVGALLAHVVLTEKRAGDPGVSMTGMAKQTNPKLVSSSSIA